MIPQDLPESWPVVATRDIHRDAWVVAVRADDITLPSGGEPFERLVVEHPGAALVLAVDDDERALVLTQYRHAVQQRVVQLPAGLIDGHDEDPLDVAKRELREETEYAATDWRPLASYLVSPGITNERYFVYLARGLSRASRGDFELAHEELDMATAWVPVEDLIAGVFDGRLSDGGLTTAVLAYDARKRRGDL